MVGRLIEGYREFRASHYARYRALYERLAAGQQPRALVIGCCDSRVDPATVLNAAPGELFVVRNVANLVPPFTPDGGYHGTSAAVEFAVSALGVRNIVVLGHARCGGIQALREEAAADGALRFVPQWMSIGRPVRDRILAASPGASAETLQRRLEHALILASLDNLRGFPFIEQRLAEGGLALHGWYFDIATGALSRYERDEDAFVEVTC